MRVFSAILISAVILGANAFGKQVEGSVDQSSVAADLESAFTAGPRGLDGRHNEQVQRARAAEFIETVFPEGEKAARPVKSASQAEAARR